MEIIVQEEKTLTSLDRCDAGNCGAQAYVKAVGMNGELLFCGHHYDSITNNAVGWDRLEKFAYQILDERDRLIENRLMGED